MGRGASANTITLLEAAKAILETFHPASVRSICNTFDRRLCRR
jgi:hypothetical protein